MVRRTYTFSDNVLHMVGHMSHSKRQFMGSYSCSHTGTEVKLDCQFCRSAVEHTECVCVCVYIWRGCHFPMNCIATTVKEVKILTVNVPVGALVILCLNVCTKGRGVTAICTVVTTVTVTKLLYTVVNGHATDYKWLVDGQSIPNLSVNIQEIWPVHTNCGTADSIHISTTENISHCKSVNQMTILTS